MPKALVKGKKRRPASRKKTPEAKAISTKIVLHPSDETPQYYVNFAEIANSQNEFSIYGAIIPTKLPAGEIDSITKTGELHLEPEVQIIIPVTVIQGLIRLK